ncbi:MAG: exonuclease [Roseivivax sp.]|nr:exonuclease [Roseivivax sp.]
MAAAVIFDCEYLTTQDAATRFWNGPYDPDPLLAKLGMARLGLEGDYPVLETLSLLVLPVDRHGTRVPLDPFFTRLTGIDEAALDRDGVLLAEAMARMAAFIGGDTAWSWGKDELNTIAVSCFVAGLSCPVPARQFANATHLLLKSGMPYDTVKTMRSNRLAQHYGLDDSALRSHDALDDALSVTYVLQHLLRDGALAAQDLR